MKTKYKKYLVLAALFLASGLTSLILLGWKDTALIFAFSFCLVIFTFTFAKFATWILED